MSNATSLAARVQAANDWPADYFISIHCNANENPAINGTEVYVYQENTQAYWLAQHVLNGIVQRTGTRNNGVRVRPGLYVLRRTKMPAILVELAYLTNTQDALRLETDPFGFAQGIMNGILEYFCITFAHKKDLPEYREGLLRLSKNYSFPTIVF